MENLSNGIEFGVIFYRLDRYLIIILKENINIFIYNLVFCFVI